MTIGKMTLHKRRAHEGMLAKATGETYSPRRGRFLVKYIMFSWEARKRILRGQDITLRSNRLSKPKEKPWKGTRREQLWKETGDPRLGFVAPIPHGEILVKYHRSKESGPVPIRRDFDL